MKPKYPEGIIANFTEVELTEEGVKPNDPDLNLGFIVQRCTKCGANLYRSERGVVSCLNACWLRRERRF